MKVAVVNLGCKVNRVESDAMLQSLLQAGCELTAPKDAQCVVINTCTVTGEAEKKTRKAVRRALRGEDVEAVVVTGCAVAINPETYEEMDERIIIERNKAIIPDIVVRHMLPHEEGIAISSHELSPIESFDLGEGLRIGDAFPTRVGIKVQDGCNNACTFCIVHVARGRASSRDFDQIIAEAKRYARAGVQEIVLTGINLGSYKHEGKSLSDLLRALLAETSQVRYRVGSIEPRDIDDELISTLAQGGSRICRHLHLPLQSGSDAILRQMARPYKMAFFDDLVERLYAAMPDLSLSTDVICGFPGETEEDFALTLASVERARFTKVHVFPYSMREGTPAAKRVDQIASSVKAARVAELSALADRLRWQGYQTRCGREEWVLVETGGKATTDSYYEIRVPDSAIPGELVCVRLQEQDYLA